MKRIEYLEGNYAVGVHPMGKHGHDSQPPLPNLAKAVVHWLCQTLPPPEQPVKCLLQVNCYRRPPFPQGVKFRGIPENNPRAVELLIQPKGNDWAWKGRLVLPNYDTAVALSMKSWPETWAYLSELTDHEPSLTQDAVDKKSETKLNRAMDRQLLSKARPAFCATLRDHLGDSSPGNEETLRAALDATCQSMLGIVPDQEDSTFLLVLLSAVGLFRMASEIDGLCPLECGDTLTTTPLFWEEVQRHDAAQLKREIDRLQNSLATHESRYRNLVRDSQQLEELAERERRRLLAEAEIKLAEANRIEKQNIHPLEEALGQARDRLSRLCEPP